jgi:glycosyltransferase involved in cell wall biosynthesis
MTTAEDLTAQVGAAATSRTPDSAVSAPDDRTRDSPVKVLITVPWPWDRRRGGAENVLWMFLRKVDRARVEPTVVFFQGGDFEHEVAGLGVKTYVLAGGRMRDVGKTLRAARELSRVLRREQPDFILNWTSHAQIYGALGGLWAGMGDRLVWRQHIVPGTESDSSEWIGRLATLFPARLVICPSKATAAAQHRLRPRRRTVVVNPGVEPLKQLAAGDLRSLRRSLGIPDGEMVIGIVGRLVPWKGQDRFLNLLADLRSRGHAVHGLIVGGSTLNIAAGFADTIRKLADRLDVSAHVTFTGQVQDAGPYLQLLDVALNLSHGEAFGVAIVEALSVGTPVVALDTGGPSEILADGTGGILVPPGQPERLRQAVEGLLSDGRARSRMSIAARQSFEHNFTAQRLASDFERIFTCDLSRGKGTEQK